MTPVCATTLSLSLLLYLTAALLFQGRLLFQRSRWDAWGHRSLIAGLVIHALGMTLHIVFSGKSPVSSVLVLVSLVALAIVALALVSERYLGARHVSLVAAPLAFVALLYALLMPVRIDAAEHLLVRFPWMGLHVLLSLLGDVGFAVAFCGAVAYLAQHRALKSGKLNRYLPSLDVSARITFRFAAGGFWFFTVGMAMGLIWFFGAPGAYLRVQDSKLWISLPTWCVFAAYVFRRGISRQHGSRLKWLVIGGFLLALASLLAVRHQFETPPDSRDTPAHTVLGHHRPTMTSCPLSRHRGSVDATG
jgi:ABC-type uncharacterized transport system permease subunit